MFSSSRNTSTKMSNFPSMLSLNSNKDAHHLQPDEKAKLISLVKTWRSKHDKVLASAQQYRDVIDTLRADIERLQEEKESVTNHLSTQLETERAISEETISKLRIEVETAGNESAIEAKQLREKLKRIQKETSPIIQHYKKRDEDMEEKMMNMKQEISSLNKSNEELIEQILKLEETSRQNEIEFSKVNDELKTKYRFQIEKVRKHCAMRLANMRVGEENKSRKEYEGAVESLSKKYEDLKTHFNKQISDMREQLETEHNESLRLINEEYNQQRHSMSIAHATEITKYERKLELENTRLRKSNKHLKSLHELLASTVKKLKETRIDYLSSLFVEVGGNKQAALEGIATEEYLGELLQELTKQQKDFKQIQNNLSRFDEIVVKSYSDTTLEDALKWEIDFVARSCNIENLKKIIRQKQSQTKKSLQKSLNNAEKLVVMNDKAPPIAADKLSKLRAPKKYPKLPKKKPLERGRDEWLFARHLSTVQFLPTVNGRQFWLNQELGGRYQHS